VIEIKVLNGDLEGALVLLKRQCQRDAIHSEIKRRETFIKPSTRRKAKEAVARRRRIKTEAKKERQQEILAEFRRVQTRRPMRRREKQ
jgi:small subunit ribosomal protein S21